MTYNVHSCIGTDAQISVERVVRVIAQTNPDVVCLQEVDVGRRRTRRAHQALEIAHALAMEFHFHSAMKVGEESYGDAIFARHPLRVIRAAPLPTARSMFPVEPRGALWAAITIAGQEWHIFNTHFGLGRTERRVQARALISEEWIGAVPPGVPLVVCGDLNSRPASGAISLLSGRLRDAQNEFFGMHLVTFSTQVPLLCLDYCFVRNGVAIEHVQTINNPLARFASDHFPLVADLSWTQSETFGDLAKRVQAGATDSNCV